uniref:Cadherin domain-containing protein n=1 Tax=Ditylenchus dipsaci TaxID=166011 RepID=A0A915DJF3_9BILA
MTLGIENMEVDQQLDPEIMKMNANELRLHTMMVCEEMGVIRNEINRINYELQHMNTTIADNEDRVKEHRHLPHLVSSIIEVLELEQTEPEEGANVDLDARKTTCAVIKTSTRLTIFLPSIGLVDPKQLKPGDLVAVHKETYLILEKLPEEYDTRVKAMEVDERPTEQYTDIGGCDKQITEIVEAIVLPLTHKERFDKLGIHPPKGVLMYGPPGTGKTMMARAVAAQTKSTFLKLAGTQLVQMYIGDGAKLVRDAFALAKAKAPTIIFIDELDAVGTKRFPSEKQGDREVQRTMMELLNQMDGFHPNDNIKVIAATNRIDVLDPALLRSGRLDRKIELPAPDEDARGRIMQIHSRKMNMSKGVNFEELARCTDDFNGAQCKAVCVESGMIALRRNSSEITHEDCMDAILEASLQNSTEYFTSKNICFFVRPTVLITESTETKASVDYFLPAVIIYWPPEDSIHTFKENKQYEMLLSVNASSTAPPTKLYSHGNSEHLRYKLVQMPNGDWKSFEIDANGVLTSSKPFDFEQKTNYELVVEVCDDDSNQKLLDRCARVRFEVVIEDLNDNCPYFPNNFTEPELFVIRENTAVQDHNKGLSLGNFEAAVRGQMENNSICYRLMDDQKHTFVISNAHKPELFVKKSLDRETIAHYKLLIVAEDCIARSQSHCDSTVNTTISTQKVIVVEVEDVNDNIPKFTQRHYFGKVVDRMTPFGDTILQLKAVDLDEEDRGLRFLLASAIHTDKMVIPKKDSPFTVNYTTGAIVSHLLDSADHEDECEVTVSLINFQHQVEFIFDKEVEVLEKELGRLERLLSEASKLRAVVDELLMYPNETTLTAHFLDKNRLALPAEEVKRSWKENKSLRGERAKKELASSFGQTRLFDAETKEEKEFNFASSTFQAITGSFKKYMPSFADFDLSLIISASALVVLFTILMCLFCWMTCCHSGTVDSVRLHDHRQWRPDTGPYYGTGTISGIIDPTLVGVSRRYRDQYSNMPNENEEFCRPSYSTPHSHQKVIPQQSTEF